MSMWKYTGDYNLEERFPAAAQILNNLENNESYGIVNKKMIEFLSGEQIQAMKSKNVRRTKF